MNFLAAVLRASLGYKIRRRAWNKDALLRFVNASPIYPHLQWAQNKFAGWENEPAGLLGDDASFDLTAEDIVSLDWEAVL